MAPVSPAQLWAALVGAGASPVQAAAVMGSAQNESGFDPEAVNPGGPAAGVGLWQWETGFYPGAASLRTGDSAADMRNQVNYLAQTGGLRAASGSTVQEAAGNFAANYERCASCQPGGQQYNSRVANAVKLLADSRSGRWPQGGAMTTAAAGSAPTEAQVAAASGSFSQTCLIGFGGIAGTSWINDIFGSGGNVGAVCFFSKSNARAIVGGAIMAIAVPLGIVGLALLVVEGFHRTGAGRAAGNALETIGAGAALVPGMEAAGLATAAAGRGVKSTPGQSAARRSRRRSDRQRAAQRQSRDDEALYQREQAKRSRAKSTRPPLDLDDEPPY